jgi:VanZ family protein
LRTLFWILCFLAAFTVSHLPPPERPAPPLINDKLLHFAGFVALGLLTLWRRRPAARLARASLLGWYAALLAYAAADELTQPLAGRSCELGDWLADALGAAVGLGVYRLLQGRTGTTGTAGAL